MNRSYNDPEERQDFIEDLTNLGLLNESPSNNDLAVAIDNYFEMDIDELDRRLSHALN